MIFFSIIIPSYNRADFLPTTIQSVLRQTYPHFEVIIVDDGSTDATREVVQKISQLHSAVKYVYQANAERGAARNNGIKKAIGDFIVFFDSDDEMNESYLAILNKGISKFPNYNFYAAKYNFLRQGKVYNSSMASFQEGSYGVDTVLKGNAFACNFCVRKSNANLKLFIEDRTLATTEDWMFLVENLSSDKIYVFDEVGMSMQQHDGRSMQQNQMLIERRIKATELLCNRVSFSPKETNLLWAYSYYFCSIHAYLDFNRVQAIHFLNKAIRLVGWQKEFLVAFIKYIVGKKTITKFSSLLSR